MNYIIQLYQIGAQALAAIAALNAGVPQVFRTYVGGKHIEVTVQEIP